MFFTFFDNFIYNICAFFFFFFILVFIYRTSVLYVKLVYRFCRLILNTKTASTTSVTLNSTLLETALPILFWSQAYSVVARVEPPPRAAQKNKLNVVRRHIIAARKTGAIMYDPVRVWRRLFCKIQVPRRRNVFFTWHAMRPAGSALLNI